MSKASELRDMSSEQLELTLKDAAASLFRLRIQAQTERLDAPTERKNRRMIARIKTIQRQARTGSGRRGRLNPKSHAHQGREVIMPRRVEVGIVTGDKMHKSRRVEIPRLIKHAKYGKYLRRKTICHVHDENNMSHVGDTVEIVECAEVEAEAVGPGADRRPGPTGRYRGHAACRPRRDKG